MQSCTNNEGNLAVRVFAMVCVGVVSGNETHRKVTHCRVGPFYSFMRDWTVLHEL